MEMNKLIELDDFEGVKQAVQSGQSVNAIDRVGCTALMRAVVKHDYSMASWLISNDANVNQKDKQGWTALHYAAQEGDVTIAKLLLDNHAEVDSLDINGNTPLIRTIMSCSEEFCNQIVSLLLEFNANAKLQNTHGISAFDVAPEHFNP